jgi:hypothetical protein
MPATTNPIVAAYDAVSQAGGIAADARIAAAQLYRNLGMLRAALCKVAEVDRSPDLAGKIARLDRCLEKVREMELGSLLALDIPRVLDAAWKRLP